MILQLSKFFNSAAVIFLTKYNNFFHYFYLKTFFPNNNLSSDDLTWDMLPRRRLIRLLTVTTASWNCNTTTLPSWGCCWSGERPQAASQCCNPTTFTSQLLLTLVFFEVRCYFFEPKTSDTRFLMLYRIEWLLGYNSSFVVASEVKLNNWNEHSPLKTIYW